MRLVVPQNFAKLFQEKALDGRQRSTSCLVSMWKKLTNIMYRLESTFLTLKKCKVDNQLGESV